MRKVILTLFFLFLPGISLACDTYGSNYLSGKTPTCSSAEFGACINLTDGNTATYWLAENASWPHWNKFDFGIGVTQSLSKVEIYAIGDVGGCGIKNWSVSGSNDGTNYTQITPTSTASNCTSDTTFTATSSDTTEYRYLIFNYPDGYRASNQTWVGELYGYECLDETGSTSTISTTTRIMSDQLDFLLQLLVEAIFVILGMVSAWLMLRNRKKE